MAVLIGLNLHGFLARLSVFLGAFGVGLSVLNLKILDLGLPGAAIALTAPVFLSKGFIVPRYICRRVGLTMSEYFRGAFGLPLACCVPFGLALLANRIVFSDRPLLALLCGSLSGGLVLAPLYWKFLAPDQVRTLVLQMLPQALARRPRPARV
jgi:hypothetical protein